MKILIIGNARHGKDTVAEIIRKNYGLTFKSSSLAASEIFIFNHLKNKYGYKTSVECFNDRVNHRDEWYNLIKEYNNFDKLRLCNDILKHNSIYVGMRDKDEIKSCRENSVFDIIIGVYDPRKSLESPKSFNINLWDDSDVIIPNSGTLIDLENKVKLLIKPFILNNFVSNELKNNTQLFINLQKNT